MQAAVDNDILYKGTCYGLLTEFIHAIPAEANEIAVLGQARYVLSSKLAKKALAGGSYTAIQRLNAFLSTVSVLEPTEEEVLFAAELEALAQIENLAFDTGESQLVAVVISRVRIPVQIGHRIR